MASPQAAAQEYPASFTDLDKYLVEKSELALDEGLQLERWTRNPNRRINKFPLDLGPGYQLQNSVFGYFSDVTISGRELTAMGVRQEVQFGRLDVPNPEERLKDYVLRVFLNSSHWTAPDGNDGGFTYQQMLYRLPSGACERYPDGDRDNTRAWTEIGTKYQWSLFTVFIHDFVMDIGPFKKRLKEAAALVQHKDFIHVVENPKPGYKLEVSIGYPFIDFAPIPNFFGFGPGKFAWAVKTFQFFLTNDNRVECDMEFVAGARPVKVLDFGKFIPDPIYSGAHLVHMFTLGIFNAQTVHDKMDGVMLVQHAKVHQALLEGASKIFAAWVADPSVVSVA